MSYVLEGIVVPVAESIAAKSVDAAISFDVLPLDDKMSILARPGRPTFDDTVADIAKRLSVTLGAAVLVRWDDRIGVRECRVFRDGSQTHQFGNDDELYVTVDDDGMPLCEGRKFREAELDGLDDEEFEIFQNALELGCEQSRFCSWRLLHEFIKRQG